LSPQAICAMNDLRRLWRGELPLGEAFWGWAVLGGLLVNLSTTFGFYLLIIEDLLIPALLVGYALSLPYNFVVMVGVWRSANAYKGDKNWANLAKIITLVGMALLSAT
jgi:hypothetical protein